MTRVVPTPRRRGLTAVALVVALCSFGPAAGAAADDGPEPGTRYSVDESGVALGVFLLPSGGAREVLVHLRIDCDGFTPEARVVVPVRDGRFRVRGTFSDPETTDVVDAVVELTGRFRGDDTARVDVAVDLEAYDNGGATGSCDREVEDLVLDGEPDEALGALRTAVALPGRLTPALAAVDDGLLVANRATSRTTLLVIDDDGAVTGRTRVDGSLDAVAVVDGTVWTLDADAGVLSSVDLEDGSVASSVEVGAPVGDTPPGDPGRAIGAVVATAGGLWTATATEILRVDPATATVAARVPTGGSRVLDLTADDDAVFVVVEDRGDDGLTGRILRIDPATSEIAAEVAVPSPFVGPLAVDADALWTARPLERRDRVSLDVLADGADEVVALGIAAAAPGVWVGDLDGLVVRDEDLGSGFDLPGIRGDALLARDGMVWVADAGIGRLFAFAA